MISVYYCPSIDAIVVYLYIQGLIQINARAISHDRDAPLPSLRRLKIPATGMLVRADLWANFCRTMDTSLTEPFSAMKVFEMVYIPGLFKAPV